MPTLAELRARKSQPRPRAHQTCTLVEGQHLLDEESQLLEELSDLQAQVRDSDGNPSPTRKMGQGLPPRADEIKARVKELQSELLDHQGVVSLTGMTGGEWQNFKDEHPAREGNEDDERVAFARCNSSALFAALGRFVSAWDGEDVDAAAWDDWLADRICYADRRDMVTAVVEMQEAKLPKGRSPISSSTPSDESA